MTRIQRRVRPTKSYALAWSIKHTYGGIHYSAPTPAADEPRKSYRWLNGSVGNHSVPLAAFPRYSLKRRAMIFSSILRGVHCVRDTPVVAPLCPILSFGEYHDDGPFPLLRYSPPPPLNTNGDMELSPSQGGITVEDDLEQLNGDSIRSNSFFVR